MATQLAETFEQGRDDDDHGSVEQSGARDFEAEAREHGWTPKEVFKGDQSRWVDAETFVKRADEVMPLLKKKTEVQDRRIADLEKTIRQQTKLLSSAEQRSYERAVAELKEQRDDAVEAGDKKAVDAIGEKITALAKELPTEKPATYTAAQAKKAYAEWRVENEWYDKGALASASPAESSARAYADALTDLHSEKADDMSPTEFFAMISGLVVEKYPALTGKAPRAKPASDVAGPTNGRGNGGGAKGFNDLPNDAKQACDALARRKALPGKDLTEQRAYYAKHFDWN
jgi:hypothetical protein